VFIPWTSCLLTNKLKTLPDFFQIDFFVGCEERNIFQNSKQYIRDERTAKFFSPSPVLSDEIESDPVLIRKIFEILESDPVLVHQCKIMYFHFAS